MAEFNIDRNIEKSEGLFFDYFRELNSLDERGFFDLVRVNVILDGNFYVFNFIFKVEKGKSEVEGIVDKIVSLNNVFFKNFSIELFSNSLKDDKLNIVFKIKK